MSKTFTLRQKVDVEAVHHLGHQNASKTFTLSEKLCQKHGPSIKKLVGAVDFQGVGIKHAHLQQKVNQKHIP